MHYLYKVRDFFARDALGRTLGICIDHADRNFAICSMDITDRHLNAAGMVEGGSIFALGDFCFAVAANCSGKVTVTLNATITYIRPVKGSKLISKATISTSTRQICSCKVNIKDELGNEIAEMLVTGFITDKDNGLSPEDHYA